MRKSRVEILKNKLARLGESADIHPAMPDDVADDFLAELRFDPCDAPNAARDWRPDNRNEQPWIKGLLDAQPRIARAARGLDAKSVIAEDDDSMAVVLKVDGPVLPN